MFLDWLVRRGYFGQIKTASITEAKNRLSALIDGLDSGAAVLIIDRGRPVARLEPVTGHPGVGAEEGNGRLARLVRAGAARARRRAPPPTLFTSPPPRAERGASVLAALLEERRRGR
ncbi:MAG: type II toxin-antitoxin system Phd/YefM family antitoxin [Caulobacteraceae bacterium]